MGLSPENSELKRALCKDGRSFQTIMSRGTASTGRHTKSATGAANPNVWENTLNDMAEDFKHAERSKAWIHTMHLRTDFSVIRINRVKLRSPIQVEEYPDVEIAQREKMLSMSRNLVDETFCDDFTPGFCAAIDRKKNSFFSFVEGVVAKMMSFGGLDKTTNQSIVRWS